MSKAQLQLHNVCFIVFDHVHALSSTSTRFKLELMFYCLHCPTLNKVFLLLLLLLFTLTHIILIKFAKSFVLAQIRMYDANILLYQTLHLP